MKNESFEFIFCIVLLNKKPEKLNFFRAFCWYCIEND